MRDIGPPPRPGREIVSNVYECTYSSPISILLFAAQTFLLSKFFQHFPRRVGHLHGLQRIRVCMIRTVARAAVSNIRVPSKVIVGKPIFKEMKIDAEI